MARLNSAGIVRRELSPQSILIEAESDRTVLTEFELAKLLGGSPTVSSDDWPIDPYRAPEASAKDVDQRAGIFSWGRVTLHLLLGTLPAEGTERDALQTAKLPKKVEHVLLKTVSASRRSRPGSPQLLPKPAVGDGGTNSAMPSPGFLQGKRLFHSGKTLQSSVFQLIC